MALYSTHMYSECCLISHLQGIGFTLQDPDAIHPVPTYSFNLVRNEDSWLFWYNKVRHDGQELCLNISTEDLKEGDSIGCCITIDGDWDIYFNGKKRAVAWRNVPTGKPLWGVVDLWGKAKSIQSEFYCGELYSESLRLRCVKHTILCTYICAH